MDWLDLVEIFTLVTGVIYLILEILQKKEMWIVGFFSALAAVIAFSSEKLFASMGLNIYYLSISVLGYISWKQDSQRLSDLNSEHAQDIEENGNSSNKKIHLNKLHTSTVLISLAVLIAGTIILSFILKQVDDPRYILDAVIAILSAIATYWLTKSYIHQWTIWIVADLLSAYLCFTNAMPWMGILYLFYSLSAIYGYFHWKKNGLYISN